MSTTRDDRWIATFTGRKFWPLDPRPEDVCIEDIAHALAMKCRYGGHCLEFYSVAQHSVLASHLVPSNNAIWGLMHDAAEAYSADIVRPIKKSFPMFQEVEDRLLSCIQEAFHLPPYTSVEHIDRVLLATERRDILRKTDHIWGSLQGGLIEPVEDEIIPQTWQEAEKSFLERYKELTQ